jgi:hypothetical protein
MKAISLLVMILFSTSIFANTQIIELIETQIGVESTCVDDYIKREEQLRKFLIWAPPTTVLAAPTAFAAGGLAAAGVMHLTGLTGWSALGYTVGTAMVSGVAVLGAFIGLETVKAIEFFRNRYMIRLITAVQNEDYSNKVVTK